MWRVNLPWGVKRILSSPRLTPHIVPPSLQIVHKNGSAFSSAEVFALSSILSKSNPVWLEASWTSSRVTGKTHANYGPVFMDSFGSGYGWMWGTGIDGAHGTLGGTSKTSSGNPAWTASNAFAWYGRGGRQSSVQKWYPQPAPKPCGAFMSLGFKACPAAVPRLALCSAHS